MQLMLHFVKHMDNETSRRSHAANGWQTGDYKKLRDKAGREFESRPYPGQSMLEVRPASHWIIKPREQMPRAELYGPMWREGDVSVLFGAKSVGKSLFAVQLAEDIATGSRSLTQIDPKSPRVRKGRSPDTTQDHKVLLVDLEHTAGQFTERYTNRSPLPGKRPYRTRFHFQRASIGEVGQIPKCFKGRIHEYLLHSIADAIETSGAKVVIIDGITYMLRGRPTAHTMTSVLKSLKLFAQTNNVSILATAPTVEQASLSGSAEAVKRAGRIARPARSRHVRELQLASLADSVILLAASTYGPEYRYTKLLAARSSSIPRSEVLTYQLRGNTDPFAGNAGTLACSSDSPLSTLNSPLVYLGPSKEHDHLRDYEAEALAEELSHQRELKRLRNRSSKDILVDGVLDGSYGRYLKGE